MRVSASAVLRRPATRKEWLLRGAAVGVMAMVAVGVDYLVRPRVPVLHVRSVREEPSAVTRVVYAADGRTLAVAGRFGPIVLRDAATGAERLRLKDAPKEPKFGQSFPITAFSPDGRMIAVGSPVRFGGVSVYNTTDGRELAALPGTDGALALRFTPDGNTLTMLLTRAPSATVVKLWDTATWRERPAPSPDLSVTPLVFHALAPDGTTAATAVYGRATISLWDLSDGHKRADLRAPGFGLRDPGLRSVAFSPDGQRLAAGWADGIVHVWDLKTNTVCAAFKSGPGAVGLFGLAFTPDGRWLAGRRSVEGRSPDLLPPPIRRLIGPRSFDRYPPSRIFVWDIATGRPRLQATEPWSETSFELSISPDGRTLATIDHRRIKFWDLDEK